MANTFERIATTGTLAGSTIATVPTGSTWIIIGFSAANVSGYLLDITVTAAGKHIVKSVPIPDGSTTFILDGKLVLKEGDTITETCSIDAGVEYIMSYMEAK